MTQNFKPDLQQDIDCLTSTHNLSPLISIAVVIPAAGIGARMRSAQPKQYIEVNGKTILEHTLERLLQHNAVQSIVVAISPDDTTFHSLSCASHPKVTSVIGGKTRAESVLAGLNSINCQEFPWVLVHDAARPNIKHADLNSLLTYCATLEVEQLQAGAILASKVRDTIKHGTTEISHTVPREYLWNALTPQCCRTQWLTSALNEAVLHGHAITDEASALEEAGYKVGLVAGDPWNIKVTQPEDLALIRLLLSVE